jgi:hypothetical protein
MMPEMLTPKVACPSCGKQYKWKPELAGKQGKCKCGGVVSFPTAAPREPDPEPQPAADPFADPFDNAAYDVADEPAASPPPPPPPPPPPSATPHATGAAAADEDSGGSRRPLKIVPALKWLGIGAVLAVIAAWELASPTDPDAPGRKRGLRALFVFANMIHPRGAFFAGAALALFFLVVGVLILFGKAKDDDYEHEQQQDAWPASRGRR